MYLEIHRACHIYAKKMNRTKYGISCHLKMMECHQNKFYKHGFVHMYYSVFDGSLKYWKRVDSRLNSQICL
jgi:hypothetical protein